MRVKLFCMLIVILVLSTIVCGSALADPLAELYYQPDNPGQGPTDAVNYYLDYAGYDSNMYSPSGITAYYVRRTMHLDAVFYCYGHGRDGGGGMICKDDTYLTAEMSPYSWAYSMEAKYADTTYKLKDNRFCFFDGCQTARYSSELGNLVTYAHDLYADCALGFYENVSIACNEIFVEKFFEYACDDGETLYTSALLAEWDVYLQFQQYGGVDSFTFAGIPSRTLVPAAYGTYN